MFDDAHDPRCGMVFICYLYFFFSKKNKQGYFDTICAILDVIILVIMICMGKELVLIHVHVVTFYIDFNF